MDVLNGSVDATNLASNAVTTAKITDANVTDAKLASPNNSVYRPLLSGVSGFADAYTAATYGVGYGGGILQSATASIVWPWLPTFYFDDADYTVGSLTQKLRLRAQVNNNATAWSSVTATFGLYPISFAGTADTMTCTLGTVVSGSTVAIANPGASSTSQGNSGDFTVPADGQYCLGVVLSAAITSGACGQLAAQLQTRNV